MTASIIIPTANRPGLATDLASQIRSYSKEVEIIIVNQGVTAPDEKILQTLDTKLVIEKEINTSKAKNIGIQNSSGEIVVFFDDDVEITKDTIKAHLSEYSDLGVVGVAGRVINDGEPVPSDMNVPVGEINDLLTKFDKNFWSTKKQTVEFPYGCNMSFRRNALVASGGFDEKLPPPLSAYEEIDLAIRIRKMGLISFTPDALVYHHRATSGGTRIEPELWSKLYYQSYGRLIKKHVPFPFSLISLGIISLRILKESPRSFMSFLKGFFL